MSFSSDVKVELVKQFSKSKHCQVAELAANIIIDFGQRPIFLALQEDMAKALGQQMALRLGRDAQILCIDRVKLKAGDYLDVGAPVGPALPVVVKTLILEK